MLVGLAAGLLAFLGVALGGIFALVFAGVYGRVGRLGVRAACTLLLFAMIAVSVVSAVAAIRVRRDALRRLGGWNAGIVAAGAWTPTPRGHQAAPE